MKNRASIKCRLTTDRSTHVLGILKGYHPILTGMKEMSSQVHQSRNVKAPPSIWKKRGPGWTGRVSLCTVSSPWEGRCSRNNVNPGFCLKSVPTLYCAEQFAQKDKNAFLVLVQVKHALLGRVIWLGAGHGNWGVGKLMQAAVPGGTGGWLLPHLSAGIWWSPCGAERTGEATATTNEVPPSPPWRTSLWLLVPISRRTLVKEVREEMRN